MSFYGISASRGRSHHHATRGVGRTEILPNEKCERITDLTEAAQARLKRNQEKHAIQRCLTCFCIHFITIYSSPAVISTTRRALAGSHPSQLICDLGRRGNVYRGIITTVDADRLTVPTTRYGVFLDLIRSSSSTPHSQKGKAVVTKIAHPAVVVMIAPRLATEWQLSCAAPARGSSGTALLLFSRSFSTCFQGLSPPYSLFPPHFSALPILHVPLISRYKVDQHVSFT